MGTIRKLTPSAMVFLERSKKRYWWCEGQINKSTKMFATSVDIEKCIISSHGTSQYEYDLV